jgi:hypothetical protein
MLHCTIGRCVSQHLGIAFGNEGWLCSSNTDPLASRSGRRKLRGMAKSSPAPYLANDHGLKRCSLCGYPFDLDVKPSMSEAFAEHLRKAHAPGQSSEDFNQAIAP